MKNITICFLTDTWFPVYGGGPKVVLEYSKQLSLKFKYSVTIITRRFSQKDKNYQINPRIKVVRLGLVGDWNEFIPRLSFIISSFSYLLFNKFNIIHGFPFISGIPAYFAGLISNTPVVFSVFALSNQSRHKKSISQKVLAFVENIITFYIPYNLLITDNPKNLRIKNRRNITYVPNGVDIDLFNSVTTNKSKLTSFIFVGRFHEQKGILTLLKAIEGVSSSVRKFTCILIGYGILENYIKDYIKNRGLTHIVKIKKPITGKELVKEYKKNHFLVLPSLYEGGGIVVLEAWAAKIPIIVTRVGNFNKIVKNGKNGYLIKPNDPAGLRSAILKMISSNKRKSMGINGFDLVNKHYTWNKSVQSLHNAYERLLELWMVKNHR